MSRTASRPRAAARSGPIELDCEAEWLWRVYQSRLDEALQPPVVAPRKKPPARARRSKP